jgi:flavin-dependent dehydrogenase
MPTQAVDFLVVGGGPAGCAFAILAADAGASVVLIERDDYQQPRAGEHLEGRVRPILDALRVPKGDAALIAAPSPGILSLWGEEAHAKLYGTTGQASGLRVVRNRFDELLCRSAQTAGVTVLRGRATRIDRRMTGPWRVRIAGSNGQARDIAAHSLVDASGRSACLARQLGARRINHGDLLAIVRWLDIENLPHSAELMLTLESCAYGWWSLSVVAGATLVATLYTSAGMMKSAHATPEAWWTQALASTGRIRHVVQECLPAAHATRLYRACPARSSLVAGDRWIAVGDAAIAYDPLAGQGVAVALETACRAFEAASADPSFAALGPEYHDALLSRFTRHLEGRAAVYDKAASILSQSFLRSAVSALHQPGVAQRDTITAPVPATRGPHA